MDRKGALPARSGFIDRVIEIEKPESATGCAIQDRVRDTGTRNSLRSPAPNAIGDARNCGEVGPTERSWERSGGVALRRLARRQLAPILKTISGIGSVCVRSNAVRGYPLRPPTVDGGIARIGVAGLSDDGELLVMAATFGATAATVSDGPRRTTTQTRGWRAVLGDRSALDAQTCTSLFCYPVMDVGREKGTRRVPYWEAY